MKLGRGIVTFQDDVDYDRDGYIISGKWECENGITVELVDNVLTIDGKGILESDVSNLIKRTVCYSSKYKVKCIIHDGITELGDHLFGSCYGLDSIEIPSSVTSIGDRAFAGCSSLTIITNHSSTSLTLDSSIHSDENGQWYLENTDTIVTFISNGQIAIYKKAGEDDKPIEEVKYGDISGDGEINVQDAVLLKKHLASIKGMDINEQACDVNADGTVNIQDAVILLKYLAGMDVTLGKQKVLE